MEPTKLSFPEWLHQLAEYAIKQGYPENMAHDAGVWRDYYDGDYSPVDAIDEDMTYWED